MQPITSLLLQVLMGVLGIMFFCRLDAKARTINVQVYDDQNNAPVEYSHVVFKLNKGGLIANGEGTASFQMDDAIVQDTVKVSCIGYETSFIPLDLSTLSGDTLRIPLTQKTISLGEVKVVKPGKTKTLTFGKGGPGGFDFTPFVPVSFEGLCFGWKVGKKNKRTWLTQVGVYSLDDTIPDIATDYKTLCYPLQKLKLRVNVYDAGECYTKDRLLYLTAPEPITSFIIEYRLDKTEDGVFVHTLSDPILLPTLALVEIEFLESFPVGETFIYRSNLFGKKTFLRNINNYDNAWAPLNFAFPFFIRCVQESL